jgi:hypothetical protein
VSRQRIKPHTRLNVGNPLFNAHFKLNEDLMQTTELDRCESFLTIKADGFQGVRYGAIPQLLHSIPEAQTKEGKNIITDMMKSFTCLNLLFIHSTFVRNNAIKYVFTNWRLQVFS